MRPQLSCIKHGLPRVEPDAAPDSALDPTDQCFGGTNSKPYVGARAIIFCI
jgi:hypothetical protein